MRRSTKCCSSRSGRWVLLIILVSVFTLPSLNELLELEHDDTSADGVLVSDKTTLWTTTINFDRDNGFLGVQSSGTKKIRMWGCDLKETPLVYVHLGNSGGGSVRARIAASSVNYTKNERWWSRDGSFYPIATSQESEQHAYYCNSAHNNFRPNGTKTFEGTYPCRSRTPIGQAIACPGVFHPSKCRRGCEPESTACRQVYTGHNFMGSEMHWLPPKYLAKWWADVWQPDGNDPITKRWNTLRKGSNDWCHPFRNLTIYRVAREHRRLFENCSVPLGDIIDQQVVRSINKNPLLEHTNRSSVVSWGPVYASVPLLRVALLREPFSWLLSKFFWHMGRVQQFECDDIEMAVKPWFSPASRSHLHWTDLHSLEHFEALDAGWVERYAMLYIIYLCGEDCESRLFDKSASLEDLELQAEDNLRQSFAVVGLLNETGTFYEMITTRVQYMNTSLNMHVVGQKHSASPSRRCLAVYHDPEFRSKLLEASPALSALVRLFRVAVEVNRFQVGELRQCGVASPT